MAIISVVIFVMICVLAGATFITNGRSSGPAPAPPPNTHGILPPQYAAGASQPLLWRPACGL
jgi:hypothetical protein